MGKIISFKLPEDTVDEIDKEANNLNMSRSKYIRQHFFAGQRLFQSSGKLDREMLQQLVKNDEATALQDDLTTDAEGIENEILAILPTEKVRAATKNEIRKSIFGTIEDQEERLDEALNHLEEREQIIYTVNSDDDPVIYKYE